MVTTYNSGSIVDDVASYRGDLEGAVDCMVEELVEELCPEMSTACGSADLSKYIKNLAAACWDRHFEGDADGLSNAADKAEEREKEAVGDLRECDEMLNTAGVELDLLRPHAAAIENLGLLDGGGAC